MNMSEWKTEAKQQIGNEIMDKMIHITLTLEERIKVSVFLCARTHGQAYCFESINQIE